MSDENANLSQKEDAASIKKEEFNLVVRFMKAAERKLDQLTLRDSNFKLDKEESKLLMEINNSGLFEGAVAGILTLVVLRRIRSGFLQRLQRQTATHTTTPHAPKSPFQQQKPPVQRGEPTAEQQSASIAEGVRDRRSSGPGGAIFNILSWMIDGTVSFYVAVYVSLRNPDQILQKISDLPLVEGRSRIAEELCPEFLQELRKIQEDCENGAANSMQQKALQNPQSSSLKALLQFCHNCKQRAAYEKLLRQENGLPADAFVSIPSPGVPHNGIPMDTLSGNNTSAWEGEPQEADFYDPSQDGESASNDDWAESFVTDQEDQQKEERRQGKK